MVYFHNDVARITLHPAGEYVHLHWAAAEEEDAARQHVMNHVLAALRTQGWQKLLASQQAAFPFSVEMQVWLQLDWRPRAVQAGYRYCALVKPHEWTAQMELADIRRQHTAAWPRYYLGQSEEQAQAWLIAQPRVA